MKSELNALCSYAKEKIAVSELTKRNYISTENMAPNRGGVAEAATLPTTEFTQRYRRGDVLVSNIRPYFKKIWLAKEEGGCSNDVLVFRAADVCEPAFLYYVLADDAFFDYSTSTAKGTKMPRGDKSAIMKYEVPVFERETQRKIAAILSALDDKIELNRRINANLEQQAAAIYVKFFPYETTDALPEGWRVGTVGEIVEIHDSKRVPLSGAERMKMENKKFPYYGAASLMDYVEDYLFDGKYLLLGEDGTVVDAKGRPILQYVWGKFWVNNHAHVLTGKLGFNVESLMLLFKQTYVKPIVTGAVQPKISQANLRSLPIVVPPMETLNDFNDKVAALFTQFRVNEEQNKVLAAVRDALTPRLMSGEIDVSEVSL